MYPGNWMAIGHAVVYYARITHAFIAEIKCRHCRYTRFSHKKRKELA